MTVINPRVLAWFEHKRKLDPELVARMGIYSGVRSDTGVVPHPEGEIIVFPTLYQGGVLNDKYRAAGKVFWQRAGGTKAFYNCEVLDDPALVRGDVALTICEGEIDCLTAIQCGFPHTVSVPDGAPPEGSPKDISPDEDQKFSYILRDWDKLKRIKRIILAVDNDGPGKRLAEELVRRLGRVRCYWIEYPPNTKDLNEVHVTYGPEEVARVLNQAKPYPVNGLYTLSGFPEEPELKPLTTGWGRLDEYLLVYYPSFMVVTGYASAGKTLWSTQLVAQLAKFHGWRCAIASYEMRINPFLSDTLRAAYLERPRPWSPSDIQDATAWIEDNFVFISAPSDDEEDSHDLDWLIERAGAAVIRHGIRVLLIDPWNEIEHFKRKGESPTDYSNRAIRQLKKFGRDFDVMVILVAHPTKEGAKKKPEDLSLYDIADSAAFANKADLGVVINRQGSSELTSVLVRKVRYQPETGKIGSIDLVYDPATRIFSQ